MKKTRPLLSLAQKQKRARENQQKAAHNAGRTDALRGLDYSNPHGVGDLRLMCAYSAGYHDSIAR